MFSSIHSRNFSKNIHVGVRYFSASSHNILKSEYTSEDSQQQYRGSVMNNSKVLETFDIECERKKTVSNYRNDFKVENEGQSFEELSKQQPLNSVFNCKNIMNAEKRKHQNEILNEPKLVRAETSDKYSFITQVLGNLGHKAENARDQIFMMGNINTLKFYNNMNAIIDMQKKYHTSLRTLCNPMNQRGNYLLNEIQGSLSYLLQMNPRNGIRQGSGVSIDKEDLSMWKLEAIAWNGQAVLQLVQLQNRVSTLLIKYLCAVSEKHANKLHAVLKQMTLNAWGSLAMVLMKTRYSRHKRFHQQALGTKTKCAETVWPQLESACILKPQTRSLSLVYWAQPKYPRPKHAAENSPCQNSGSPASERPVCPKKIESAPLPPKCSSSAPECSPSIYEFPTAEHKCPPPRRNSPVDTTWIMSPKLKSKIPPSRRKCPSPRCPPLTPRRPQDGPLCPIPGTKCPPMKSKSPSTKPICPPQKSKSTLNKPKCPPKCPPPKSESPPTKPNCPPRKPKESAPLPICPPKPESPPKPPRPKCKPPLINEDSPMLSRGFYQTDWTKPKFDVNKPYTEGVRKDDSLTTEESRTKPDEAEELKSNVKEVNNVTVKVNLTYAGNQPSKTADFRCELQRVNPKMNLEQLIMPAMSTIPYAIARSCSDDKGQETFWRPRDRIPTEIGDPLSKDPSKKKVLDKYSLLFIEENYKEKSDEKTEKH